MLTTLAQQTYGDGSIPDIVDVVTVATFLFGAGQDTTIRTFAAMLRFLTEDPGLQRRLRADRKLIPDFVEEVLRLEGTAKTGFRLAKVPTKVRWAGSRAGHARHADDRRDEPRPGQSSPILPNCASTARTCATMSPSDAAPTAASARPWRGPSAG